MRRPVALSMAVLLAASVHAADQPAPEPLPDAGHLGRLLAAHDVPGAAMVAIDGCAVGETVSAGMADLERGVPVVAETAFEAASLSRTVFAWLVMSLVEEGTLDLDAPIAAAFEYPASRTGPRTAGSRRAWS